ncbi:hypothetical protein PHYBOEH_001968 [Phytophthora boehmeriae]|uniref:Uncharacterized protein n=1 Tax=Phytophthora boehmeriae TaxID=109152 RepID=A0A8T1WT07_9STRA|nr:hypothetical protein PHYBOEH_001968 [Phytophthora boehmeriae]
MSAGTCSAAAKSQLDPAPLSPEELEILSRLLPRPTSEQSVASGELRAPLHIPCQMKAFPYLQEFVAEIQHHGVPNFEVVPENCNRRQMLHFTGFVISPTWTGFELRDLVMANLER